LKVAVGGIVSEGEGDYLKNNLGERIIIERAFKNSERGMGRVRGAFLNWRKVVPRRRGRGEQKKKKKLRATEPRAILSLSQLFL